MDTFCFTHVHAYSTSAGVLLTLAGVFSVLADALFILADVLFTSAGVLFTLADVLFILADALFTSAGVLFDCANLLFDSADALFTFCKDCFKATFSVSISASFNVNFFLCKISEKLAYNVPRLDAVACFYRLIVKICKFPAFDFPAKENRNAPWRLTAVSRRFNAKMSKLLNLLLLL